MNDAVAIDNRGKNNAMLHMAVHNRNLELAEDLLAKGADPQAMDDQGKTPLQRALSCTDPDNKLVELLMEKSDINRPDNNGKSALIIAVEHAPLNLMSERVAIKNAIIQGLLDARATPDQADNYGNTALHYAINKPDVMMELLRCGGNLHAENHHGDTPMYLMTRQRGKSFCRTALNRIIAPEENPQHTLPWTALWGSPDENWLRDCIARGADINAGCAGYTPLHWAVTGGNVHGASLLLQVGCDPDAPDPNGHSPLYHAVREGNERMVEILLDGGADTNTAMQAIAYQFKRTDLTAARRMINSDPKYAQRRLKNLRDHIGNPQRRRLLNQLLKHGLNLALRDAQGDTLLHVLCSSRCPHQDLTRLLDHGAPVNAYNKAGESPLYLYALNPVGSGSLKALLDNEAEIATMHRDRPDALTDIVLNKWLRVASKEQRALFMKVLQNYGFELHAGDESLPGDVARRSNTVS